MVALPRPRRLWDSLLSIGAYPGETDVQRGKRRILVGYLAIGAVTRLIAALLELSDGNPEAVVDFSPG